jgi:hypothetical protein
MLKSIWNVVGYDNIFSGARASVGNCDCIRDSVAWANFFRSAFRADKNRLCAKKGAETNRCSCCAETGAKVAFALALQPYFSVNALTFVHRTDVPGQFFTFYFRFRCRLYERNAVWKMSVNHYIANGVASFNNELERILIAQHAH